ncbi:MAG: VIT1/CCC1 transporter family protein [Candidatus Nanoarchaeia archaeon]|nr:VIT1/CCC1 transporter family protein [Candidatus Nanoarchaeia archaeon]
MQNNKLSQNFKQNIIISQKNEITEYHIYKKLSEMTKNAENKKVLFNISKDELEHYDTFKKYSKIEVKPFRFKIFFYIMLAKILGLTFSLKLMEKGEAKAQINYEKIIQSLQESKKIMGDEQKHESELINMISEEKLNYAGSIVLGLNDALVEITSTIAGITFTMQNSKLIATTGLIMGIAASLSMAASEYLSTKTGEEKKSKKNPITALLYTGISYILAVILIVLPYFIFSNVYIALAVMLLTALTIIFLFTFYISVAKDVSFKKRFLEMAGVSMGIAIFTFLIGIVVRTVFGIEI